MNNDRKMSGKQAVSGGFDLEAFVGAADPAPVVSKPASQPPSKQRKTQERPKPSVVAAKAPTGAKIANQEASGAEERLTERVQLKLTPSEFAKLKDEVGMVPVSAFLRKFLQDKGLI